MPAKLITEAVPPSLVASTVEAAIGIGASKTIQSAAASALALALTQGVLTTMKLAQLKVVGCAILATSLSAGSVIAVSYAAGQGPKDARDANAFQVNSASADQPPDTPTSKEVPVTVSPSVEKRLRSLEGKLDELLTRSKPGAAAVGNIAPRERDPFASNRAATERDDDGRRMADPQRRSIPELEVQLKLALMKDQQAEQLLKRNAISTTERELARGEVSLIKAMLQGRDDELADEIDRLKLEIKTRTAAREKTTAQTEVARSVVARNSRLNKRKADIVSAEDVAKAEWEMRLASAQGAMVDAEIAEVELRVQQLERRRTRIKQIIKLAG